MKKIFWLPLIYIILFAVLLFIVWSKLDNSSTIAIISVLAGGLAAVIGSFVASLIGYERLEKESEDKLKSYASTQALESTKLEFELRKTIKKRKKFLAPAKVYREFYKALFELYTTKNWPKKIEDQGLLEILDYTENKEEHSA